jgi:hypothetical protein
MIGRHIVLKRRILSVVKFIFLLFILPLSSCEKEEPESFVNYQTITLKQEFSNDWSRWKYSGDSMNGTFKTAFSNSWDRWLFNGQNQNGQIRTEFNESWDRWNHSINGSVISIRTEFNESWNRWKVTGSTLDETLFIRTQFSGDNTRWVVSTSQSVNIAEFKTEFSNDYRRWVFKMKPDQFHFTVEEMNTIFFIAIFTASIYEQGVIE